MKATSAKLEFLRSLKRLREAVSAEISDRKANKAEAVSALLAELGFERIN